MASTSIPQAVSAGCFVQVEFELIRSDTGEVLDSSAEEDALSFTCGGSEVLPGIDKGVKGMLVGQTRFISLDGDNGFGDRKPENVSAIPVEMLPPYGVEVGDQVQAHGPNGPMLAIVKEISENVAIVDFNHPHAGLPLVMKVTLLSCEDSPPATDASG